MAEQIIRPRNFTDTATDSDLHNADNYLWLDTENKAKKVEITRLAKASEQAALTTYAQNVAHSIAPEFVPNETNAVAGMPYMYDGSLYVAKEAYQGPWDANKFAKISINKLISIVDSDCAENSENITAVINSFPSEIKATGRVDSWSQGTISPTTGEDTESDYRIRTDYIDVTNKPYLDNSKASDKVMMMRAYDRFKNFVNNFAIYQGNVIQSGSPFSSSGVLDFSSFPSVKYVRIVERYSTDNTAITPADNTIEITAEEIGGTMDDVLDPIKTNVSNVIDRLPSAMYDVTSQEKSVTWSQGTISSTTGEDTESDYRIRTDFIDVVSEKLYLKNDSGTSILMMLRGYDSNKNFVDNFAMYQGNVIQSGSPFSPSGVLDFSSFPSVKYVRIVERYSTDNTAITPADNEIEIDVLGQAWNDVTFDDLIGSKKPYSAADLYFDYNIPGGYYTRGFLKLPSNYVPVGKKVPLVVFVHGTGVVENINATEMTAKPYYNYIRDCGYAIFDCYAYSSKYSGRVGSGSNTYGVPINRTCYKYGIEYVLKNYNVDPNAIFVACKSLGGLQAISMFYDETLPIKAVGMHAPELDFFDVFLGYQAVRKKVNAEDMGFSEDTDNVLDFNIGEEPPEGFWDYITENMQHWLGVSAIWCGLDIAPSDKPTYYQRMRNTGSMFRKSLNRPVKIWIAQDDQSVSYSNSAAFIQSLNNAGYFGELRTLPNGTGGHHATDSDPNALQTTNVTTPLGVFYETIPTAFYELELWFRKWL